MNLPKHKQELLDNVIVQLKRIAGVKAIVLGGSYATGMATDNSDLDIGIYYSDQSPFDPEKIKIIAEKFSGNEKPIVTGFYEWGPWVNGGAWIKTANGKIDFLYKNIEQIALTIQNAKIGIWENHFEQQPPYGFSSIMFLAETYSCVPLYDPEGIIGRLKEEVKEYPEKLKQSVIQQSLWSAEFTIWQAESFASRVDVYNTVGCFTRAIKNIVTALFAINELYPIGDKRAIEILEQSKLKPANLAQRIDTILCSHKSALTENASQLKKLFDEVVELADGEYKPYYKLSKL
jgi:hypothetical protein